MITTKKATKETHKRDKKRKRLVLSVGKKHTPISIDEAIELFHYLKMLELEGKLKL